MSRKRKRRMYQVGDEKPSGFNFTISSDDLASKVRRKSAPPSRFHKSKKDYRRKPKNGRWT